MSHSDFFPKRAQIDAGLQPLDTEFHDVLVIPPERRAEPKKVIQDHEFFRVPVVKKAHESYPATGVYDDKPERWDQHDTGQRKVINIAHPERVAFADGQQAGERGPAFAVMPIKAEPGASSCAFCYLVDAHNALSPNAWTAEEWDSTSSPNLEGAPNAQATEVEVLMALPRGIVIRFKASGLDKLDDVKHPAVTVVTSNENVTFEIEPVQLKGQSEVWSQLRNGTIAGRALLRAQPGGSRVVPLVNVTSLMPQGANQ